MKRREFLEASGLLAVGASLPGSSGDSSPKISDGMIESITRNETCPEDIPVIEFNKEGDMANLEEIFNGKPLYSDPDFQTLYLAWLNREDWVICHYPHAHQGAIWGIVLVEITEFGACLVGRIEGHDKSNRLDCPRKALTFDKDRIQTDGWVETNQ
jgi:hypothetical protein